MRNRRIGVQDAKIHCPTVTRGNKKPVKGLKKPWRRVNGDGCSGSYNHHWHKTSKRRCSYFDATSLDTIFFWRIDILDTFFYMLLRAPSMEAAQGTFEISAIYRLLSQQLEFPRSGGAVAGWWRRSITRALTVQGVRARAGAYCINC